MNKLGWENLSVIVEKLNLIKQYIKNGDGFDTGYQLGELHYECVLFMKNIKKESEEDDEYDEDEEDDEYDEDEEDDEKIFFTVEEYNEIESKLIEYKDRNKILEKERIEHKQIINNLKEIIKDLIKNDHIFPGKLELVVKNFSHCCFEESEQDLYALRANGRNN